MDINARQIKFLRLILEESYFMPIAYFIDALHCSEKTLRNDIKHINAFLQQHELLSRIQTKRGSGIRIQLFENERAKITALFLGNTLSLRPHLDRFLRALTIITCESEELDICALAKKLYISKQQLSEDMRGWQHILSSFNLQLNRNKHIYLQGKEEDIRSCVMHLLCIANPQITEDFVRNVFLASSYQFLANMLHLIEEELKFKLSSNAQKQLMVYMKIMVERSRLKHHLHYHDAEKLSASLQVLRAQLEKHFHVALPESEIDILVKRCSCATWQWNTEQIDLYRANEEAIRYTNRMRGALIATFGDTPNPELTQPLTILIEAAQNRKRVHAPVATRNEAYIKYDNMYYFLMLTQVLYDTDHLNKTHFFGSDLVRICTLLLQYFDRVVQQKRFRCALVVNAGIEQGIFGQYELERNIPNLHVTRFVAKQDVHHADTKHAQELAREFDLLISFETIDTPLPHAVISESIDTEDIDAILQLIAQLETNQESDCLNIFVKQHKHLADTSISNMFHTIYNDLVTQKIIQPNEEKFIEIAQANSMLKDSTIIFTLFSDCIEKSYSRIYDIDHAVYAFSHRIKHIAILLVKEEDRAWLLPQIQQFKASVDELAKDKEVSSVLDELI